MCVRHMWLLQILESNYLMTPLSESLKYHSEAFEVCEYVRVRVWVGRDFSIFFNIFLGFFCIHLFFGIVFQRKM